MRTRASARDRGSMLCLAGMDRRNPAYQRTIPRLKRSQRRAPITRGAPAKDGFMPAPAHRAAMRIGDFMIATGDLAEGR